LLCVHGRDPERGNLRSALDLLDIGFRHAKFSRQCSFCQIVVDPEFPEEVGKAIRSCKGL
jgi:hypothetical protein